MNDLIRFQPAKRPDRPVPDHHGAQILFFTGVRYERMTDPAPALVEGDSGAPRSGGIGARGAKRRRRG